MSATISIDKKNIKQFFEESRQKPFLIPEYQRPYEWGDDQITTLFDDLKSFAESDVDKTNEYFLGAIVHFNNAKHQREIIDGHQRIVSLMLLLRVIYTHLQSMQETRSILKQKADIEPLLWNIDPSSKEPDYSKVLIQSEVINEQTEKTFVEILRTGKVDNNATDLYSSNYALLQQLHSLYCGSNAEATFRFIDSILEHVIVLPIQADSLNMALTIFSTLNNRGLPLTDSDIFKAGIYKTLNDNQRKSFIEQWQALEERKDYVDVEIAADLFYPYMLYTRAMNKIINSTLSGVRKYFLNEHPHYLSDSDLLTKLDRILNLWAVTNQHVEIENESWSGKIKIRQALDILVSYPNDFWRHAVVTYYLANCKNNDFNKSFLLFLRKLLSQIVPRYFVRKGGADIIKTSIMHLNVGSIESPYPEFKFNPMGETQWLANAVKFHPKKPAPTKVLLKILAYSEDKQETLLPDKWQIEHIFPRKWVDNYDLNGFTPEKINELVEHLGNLTVIEKANNIKAGNEYFGKKKKIYKKSSIAMTKELARLADWRPENIITRTDEMNRRLKDILEMWSSEYDEAKHAYDQQHRAEAPI